MVYLFKNIILSRFSNLHDSRQQVLDYTLYSMRINLNEYLIHHHTLSIHLQAHSSAQVQISA